MADTRPNPGAVDGADRMPIGSAWFGLKPTKGSNPDLPPGTRPALQRRGGALNGARPGRPYPPESRSTRNARATASSWSSLAMTNSHQTGEALEGESQSEMVLSDVHADAQ